MMRYPGSAPPIYLDEYGLKALVLVALQDGQNKKKVLGYRTHTSKANVDLREMRNFWSLDRECTNLAPERRSRWAECSAKTLSVSL